jgi:hypothetical protein
MTHGGAQDQDLHNERLRADHAPAVLDFELANRAYFAVSISDRELCHLAPAQYGLRKVRAATSLQNAASQTVLTKAGFLPVGPADPADLGGKPGT